VEWLHTNSDTKQSYSSLHTWQTRHICTTQHVHAHGGEHVVYQDIEAAVGCAMGGLKTENLGGKLQQRQLATVHGGFGAAWGCGTVDIEVQRCLAHWMMRRVQGGKWTLLRVRSGGADGGCDSAPKENWIGSVWRYSMHTHPKTHNGRELQNAGWFSFLFCFFVFV
jgi:hypothetical protein